jgi:hypothetical protein
VIQVRWLTTRAPRGENSIVFRKDNLYPLFGTLQFRYRDGDGWSAWHGR